MKGVIKMAGSNGTTVRPQPHPFDIKVLAVVLLAVIALGVAALIYYLVLAPRLETVTQQYNEAVEKQSTIEQQDEKIVQTATLFLRKLLKENNRSGSGIWTGNEQIVPRIINPSPSSDPNTRIVEATVKGEKGAIKMRFRFYGDKITSYRLVR